MTLSDIPSDSLLHHFIAYMSWTESALSFQVAGGLSAIGAVLRRHRWFSQEKWQVYPNQSIIFLGPSGVGKDTIINKLEDIIRPHVKTVGGTTFGAVSCNLVNLAPPTLAYIPIKEMSSFFGKVDYQQNTIAAITDLLSSNKEVDISTKADLTGPNPERKIIYEPTITVHAGTTVEWLHQMIPSQAMSGGFLGRFHLVIETIPERSVPLVGDGKSEAEWAEHNLHWQAWEQGIHEIIRACCTEPKGMPLTLDARQLYTEWYDRRRDIFPKKADAYAYRTRDTVLRFALQMAVSRNHFEHIELADVQAAIALVNETASRIRIVLEPGFNPDLRAALLAFIPPSPCNIIDIYSKFLGSFSQKEIDSTLASLTSSGRVRSMEARGFEKKFYQIPLPEEVVD